MVETYKIAYKGGQGEIEEKKSFLSPSTTLLGSSLCALYVLSYLNVLFPFLLIILFQVYR